MKIHKVTNGLLNQNCYILEKNKNAIVIDPGMDTKLILDTLSKLKLTPTYVLLTHGHFDHIYSAYELKKLGAKVYITEKDAPKLIDNELNMGFLFKVYTEKVLPDGFLVEGKNVFEDEEFNVIFTPGHTAGSCVIQYKNNLFTGDTYFSEGVYGRTDLLDGNQEAIENSIEKIESLLKNNKVCAGHE